MMQVSRARSEVEAEINLQAKTGTRHYILSSPHLLYATESQAKLFSQATAKNESYRRSISEPIERLVRKHIDRVVGEISGKINFVDLGPGDPPTSLPIVRLLSEWSVRVQYEAVDVSRFFLDRAVDAMRKAGIDALGLECRFEDMAPILDTTLDAAIARIIFIGLTFNNFDIGNISKILAGVTRSRDRALICAQLPDGKTRDELLAPYLGATAFEFGVQPLLLLGLKRNELSYRPSFYSNAINIDFVVKRNVTLESVTLEEGTVITTGRSYRYPLSQLKSVLGSEFVLMNVFMDDESDIALLVVKGRS